MGASHQHPRERQQQREERQRWLRRPWLPVDEDRREGPSGNEQEEEHRADLLRSADVGITASRQTSGGKRHTRWGRAGPDGAQQQRTRRTGKRRSKLKFLGMLPAPAVWRLTTWNKRFENSVRGERARRRLVGACVRAKRFNCMPRGGKKGPHED